MAKTFSIVITDVDDIKVLEQMKPELLTKVLHRGVRDYLYRKDYSAKNAETLKAFTRLKREIGAKGLTIDEMIRLAAENE